MDRLAEISRPTQTSRPDANDFTRSKEPRNERPERRDDVESRADDKVKERQRPERANDKPERFSLHLEEQNASLSPQKTPQNKSADESTDGTEPETETARTDEAAQTTKSSAPRSKPVQGKIDLAPDSEAGVLEIPAAAPALEVKAELPQITAPITPPAALTTIPPVVANEALAKTALQPSDIDPIVAPAPRIEGEPQIVEVDGAISKQPAVHAETPSNQVGAPNSKSETPTEAPKIEAPRESPAARSAEEVERAADILRQIRVQITPQLSEARIQLHPIELGRISIHLSVEDGRLKTTVRAEKQETLQAIQTHLPELRASLRQHGLDAQEFQLSLGFENRGQRDAEKAAPRSGARDEIIASSTIEHSPALHAALAKTGVDFYA